MDKELDTFFELARAVQLTEQERAELRTSLQESIHAHPWNLTAEERMEIRSELRVYMAKNPVLEKRSLWGTAVTSWLRTLSLSVATLLLLTAAGAGLVFAAEKSVPGDLLYGFKLHVTEAVAGELAVTDEANAKWEEWRAGRRFAEAETLASTDQLDPAAREGLEQNIDAYMKNLDAHLAGLRHGGKQEAAAAISARVSKVLEAHAVALMDTSVQARAKARQQELAQEAMQQTLHDVRAQAAAQGQKSKRTIHAEANTAREDRLAAQASLHAGRMVLAETKAALENNAFLDARKRERVVNSITAAEWQLQNAERSFAAGSYDEAFAVGRETVRTTKEAERFLKETGVEKEN